jgi:uncharacterized protein (DUF2141 family)
MTKLNLFLAALAAAAAGSAQAADLTVTFETTEARGLVMAALYASEADYDLNKPASAQAAPAAGATAVVTFKGLAPGRYAIKSFQDLNGDGKLSSNPLGMPTEPFGFSNNAPVRMAAPSWAETVFEVGADGAAHTIKMQ